MTSATATSTILRIDSALGYNSEPRRGTHTNVYIAKLPAQIDEPTLLKFFEPYGQIECCRVQRNLNNTTGKTFGFVKFFNCDEALKAIAGMNGALINDSPIEVKLADQDPGDKASNGTPSDNLYVRNLPNTWETEEMASLFSQYGTVLDCRILHAGEGIRGAGGLVRMSTVMEAAQAIAGLNGRIPQGGSDLLFVRFADTPEEKARRKAKKSSVRGVRYAPYQLTSPRVATTGLQIIQQQPLYAVETGPFASSSWSSMEPSTTYTMTPTQTSLTPVFTTSCPVTYSPPASSNSIYVKNLPPSADKLFLYENFAKFGGVTSVNAMPDDATGLCKGIGFVNYTDTQSARNAVEQMNGLQMGDRILYVSLQSTKTESDR